MLVFALIRRLEFSDSLLKFLLDAKRPAIYRARNINVMSPDDGHGVVEIR